MITQFPESSMSEPYKSYVKQRSATIANVLEPVVLDTNVQLCPHAITPDERFFGDGLVYGCVVKENEDGLKSSLYSGLSEGIVAKNAADAVRYAYPLFVAGEQIRLKDPNQSDGDGQVIVGSPEELTAYLENNAALLRTGILIMPHIARITDRVSFGKIDLGAHGQFAYAGNEFVTEHDDRKVFAGGDLALVRDGRADLLGNACEQLDIHPRTLMLAERALRFCKNIYVEMGRCSVDVLRGFTDSGRHVTDVVDVTPRVGGHTPAETLAIAALSANRNVDIVHASGRLYYDPQPYALISGKRFVDTSSLIIAAEVTSATGVRHES